MDNELREALNKVLRLPDVGYNAYAKAYTNAALRSPSTGAEVSGKELRV